MTWLTDSDTDKASAPQEQQHKRSRLDSMSASPSIKPHAKRPRVSSDQSLGPPPSAMSTFGEAAKGKGKGKMPDIVDLTLNTPYQHSSGAKKLVIKNLRTTSKTAQVQQYYEQTWADLTNALADIFAGKPLRISYDRLYHGVEDLCRNGKSKQLYATLTEKCEAYLNSQVRELLANQGVSSNAHMLQTVLDQWRQWNAKSMLMRSIFSYLDQTYMLPSPNLPQINDLTISQFKKMLFRNSTNSTAASPGQTVILAMCEMVDHDRRSNGQFQPDLFKSCVSMLNILGVYDRKFEPALQAQSESYYQEFGETWTLRSLKEYVHACERLFRQEEYRCNTYNFDSTTKKLLLNAAHRILITDYSSKLLHEGDVSKLLSENDVESMRALYHMLRLCRIQGKLKDPWQDYIKKKGSSILTDPEQQDKMVERLLQLRRRLDIMIRDAFAGSDDLYYSMRTAIREFMNDNRNSRSWSSGISKIGEMVAKYMNRLLSDGQKSLSPELLSDAKDRAAAGKNGQAMSADTDAELDRLLDQALELFRFIEGKDAFEAFYKKDLARRLLLNRSASHDAERSMLTKLRSECGSSFTHNLEQMFKDQEVAKDEMVSYKAFCTATGQGKQSIEFDVKVLSAAAWPNYADLRINLPDNVAAHIERFDKHYQSKHSGRKLFWKTGLDTCTLKANFPKGKKELMVSAHQAVVLILFNDVPDDGFLSYEQLATATAMVPEELGRTLQSLACGKTRVISKHPKGKEVAKTDTFTFNKTFTDAKFRIKINQIQLKETKEENKATHERIVQDRKFETQAAIVRIMKARKTMAHAELVAAVIDMTKKRGSVDPPAIKKEIETLIEKDYLEREADSTYSYLA